MTLVEDEKLLEEVHLRMKKVVERIIFWYSCGSSTVRTIIPFKSKLAAGVFANRCPTLGVECILDEEQPHVIVICDDIVKGKRRCIEWAIKNRQGCDFLEKLDSTATETADELSVEQLIFRQVTQTNP